MAKGNKNKLKSLAYTY